MDKARIAENVLMLVMEPAQAASVTGDLLEAGSARSVAWFWSNVFQTFFATVWNDGKTRPLFIVGLAILGVLVEWIVGFAILLACYIMIVLPVVLYSTLLMHQSFLEELHMRGWYYYVILTEAILGTLLAPFFAGQWIARRSLGRSVAVWITMAAFAPLINTGISVLAAWGVSLAFPRIQLSPFFLVWFIGQYLRVVPCLGGTVSIRLQRLSAGTI